MTSSHDAGGKPRTVLTEPPTALRPWRPGDALARSLLDLAADRPLEVDRIEADRATVGLLRRHGLLGVLAFAPVSLVDDDDPQGIRAIATRLHLRDLARQRAMTDALRGILERLQDGGVRAAVLKGPDIAASYRNERLRSFGDVDLLVPREDVEGALDALAAAGARIPPKRATADKRDILIDDACRGVRFTLDLHWDLFSYSQLRGSADGATAAAWDRAIRSVDDPLGPRWLLPDDARITFLTAHAILDHRFRLILFRDLTELSRSDEPSWDAVCAFAARWRLRSVTYLALLMAARFTACEVPTDALRRLRTRNMPLRLLERRLPLTDVVRFDGHRAHAVNLLVVVLHDDLRDRMALAARAPVAFPHWRRAVSREAERHRQGRSRG